MLKFNQDELDKFLAVVRKYMQLRGNLNQKDLSEKTNIGISTMSRLLNKKVKDIDGQVVAQIVATLNMPMHEIIDFVDPSSEDAFIGLVNFYKNLQGDTNPQKEMPRHVNDEDALGHLGESLEETRSQTKATIKGIEVPFGEKKSSLDNNVNMSIRDKLGRLSPRQKGFLTDFLDLDAEGRDLIVDIGNSLFRFFKQKNVDF